MAKQVIIYSEDLDKDGSPEILIEFYRNKEKTVSSKAFTKEDRETVAYATSSQKDGHYDTVKASADVDGDGKFTNDKDKDGNYVIDIDDKKMILALVNAYADFK